MNEQNRVFRGGNRGERAELAVSLHLLDPVMGFPNLCGNGDFWQAEIVERDGMILKRENGIILSDGVPKCALDELRMVSQWAFSTMDDGGKGAVAAPTNHIAEILTRLGFAGVAGGHRGKADISMLLKNVNGDKMPFHVSFKSFLGSPPSLFNSGAGATALYAITPEPDFEDAIELNRLVFRERISRMAQAGMTISPLGFDGDFGERLALIDPDMPRGVLFSLACSHGLATVKAENFIDITPYLAQVQAEHVLPKLAEAATRCLTAGGWSAEPFPDAILCLSKIENAYSLNLLFPNEPRLHDSCRFVIPVAGKADEEGFEKRNDPHGLIVSRQGKSVLALGMQIRMSDPFAKKSSSTESQPAPGIGILRHASEPT